MAKLIIMYNVLVKYTDGPSGFLSFNGKEDEFDTKEAAKVAGQKIIKNNRGTTAYIVWPDHKERIYLRQPK